MMYGKVFQLSMITFFVGCTQSAEDAPPMEQVQEDAGTPSAQDGSSDAGGTVDGANANMDMNAKEDGGLINTLPSGPGMGPGPDCPNLPTRDCTGADCGTLSAFTPVTGPGYDNYPINGETANDQYRSFARKDLQMLMKYATAFVDCKAKNWTPGNMKPLGLGDMSEADGSIPGTSIGQPGHPAGTHENGYDMDIAYYQLKGQNNYLREICPHTTGGAEQYHCTGEPDNLDVWRHALFLGALFTSKRVRVIGVDGKVGPLILNAMPTLCTSGWLPQAACNAAKNGLAFETTDTGRGWFQFHQHHSHISLKALGSGSMMSLRPDSSVSGLGVELGLGDELRSLADHGYRGEALIGEQISNLR